VARHVDQFCLSVDCFGLATIMTEKLAQPYAERVQNDFQLGHGNVGPTLLDSGQKTNCDLRGAAQGSQRQLLALPQLPKSATQLLFLHGPLLTDTCRVLAKLDCAVSEFSTT